MAERYQIVSPGGSDAASRLPDSQQLAELLSKDGQLILPLLDLVEQAQVAIDDLVDVMGRATIEAVLQMSAPATGRAPAAGQEVRPRRGLSRFAAGTGEAQRTSVRSRSGCS